MHEDEEKSLCINILAKTLLQSVDGVDIRLSPLNESFVLKKVTLQSKEFLQWLKGDNEERIRKREERIVKLQRIHDD